MQAGLREKGRLLSNRPFFMQINSVMGKLDIKDIVCRPFCIFFKEGEKEEMECQGAVAVERLLETGRLRVDEVPSTGKHPGLWEKSDTSLEPVCNICPFKKEDCDYRSEDRPIDSEPCGGYILLAILKAKNLISGEDIKEIAS